MVATALFEFEFALRLLSVSKLPLEAIADDVRAGLDARPYRIHWSFHP